MNADFSLSHRLLVGIVPRAHNARHHHVDDHDDDDDRHSDHRDHGVLELGSTSATASVSASADYNYAGKEQIAASFGESDPSHSVPPSTVEAVNQLNNNNNNNNKRHQQYSECKLKKSLVATSENSDSGDKPVHIACLKGGGSGDIKLVKKPAQERKLTTLSSTSAASSSSSTTQLVVPEWPADTNERAFVGTQQGYASRESQISLFVEEENKDHSHRREEQQHRQRKKKEHKGKSSVVNTKKLNDSNNQETIEAKNKSHKFENKNTDSEERARTEENLSSSKQRQLEEQLNWSNNLFVASPFAPSQAPSPFNCACASCNYGTVVGKAFEAANRCSYQTYSTAADSKQLLLDSIAACEPPPVPLPRESKRVESNDGDFYGGKVVEHEGNCKGFFFWRFLSNLPKDITKRTTKSKPPSSNFQSANSTSAEINVEKQSCGAKKTKSKNYLMIRSDQQQHTTNRSTLAMTDSSSNSRIVFNNQTSDQHQFICGASSASVLNSNSTGAVVAEVVATSSPNIRRLSQPVESYEEQKMKKLHSNATKHQRFSITADQICESNEPTNDDNNSSIRDNAPPPPTATTTTTTTTTLNHAKNHSPPIVTTNTTNQTTRFQSSSKNPSQQHHKATTTNVVVDDSARRSSSTPKLIKIINMINPSVKRFIIQPKQGETDHAAAATADYGAGAQLTHPSNSHTKSHTKPQPHHALKACSVVANPSSTTNIHHSHQVKLSIGTTTTTTTTTTSGHSTEASSLSSCILSAGGDGDGDDDSSVSESRVRWSKKMDFLLSIIGFAVDLANIWRFPYLVYKNGGGVFLIPYLIMLIFGGVPLFFLELCLGQFVKKGPLTVWNKICPSMKGVGYCNLLISWYVSFYYNVLIAWSVYFIYRSFSSLGGKMPWEDCDNSWNSKTNCGSISQLKLECSTSNETLEECRSRMFSGVNITSPASEFFVKELSQLDQSGGLEHMGYLRMELVLCLVIVYILHYLSLFKGLETSGKVVWVTATAPYIILSILLIRGLFLPGAAMGIHYYLSPKLEKLLDPSVWIDASTQVFYSIGVGFGVHLTYASFNSHNNNCYRDCLTTSAVNVATSVYSGLVVFVYLGYMAKNLEIPIENVAREGYSLVFEIYPEALTTLPFARFWTILFFLMLLTLGIDSAMGGLEAVITGLEDEFKFTKRLSRGQLTLLVIVSSFIPALISCTQGGAYTLYWLDIYSAGISLIFAALFETIGVVYCYGLKKFIPNIESMLGKRPHIFFILCWRFISPLFLVAVIFMSFHQAYTSALPTYRDYTFPRWSVILGWCFAFSSVSAIPIVAALYWYKKWQQPDKATIRKRSSRGSSRVTSSRHGSKTGKSPNHV